MGGATISFINMLRLLKARGVEATIVIPDLDNEFKAIVDKIGGIKVIKYPIWSYFVHDYHNVLKTWREELGIIHGRIHNRKQYGALIDIINQERPDIIHTNTGVVNDGFFVARRLGIPHVWHLREYQDRDFDLHPFPTKLLFSCMLRKSYVISITKDILKNFHLKENFRHRTIYNGVMGSDDVTYIKDKEPFFLCASRITPEKGHEDVIRAFAKFHKSHSEYKLKILGFGDKAFIAQLKALASDLGCYDTVEFLGYTSDVSKYMKKAKALIVASKFEGFGRMTAEAFFNGCMVIGRDTGGTKEIMDITGGLRFKNSIEEIVNRMNEVACMDTDVYSDIVLSGQSMAQRYFSNEQNAASIYNFYKDIIK